MIPVALYGVDAEMCERFFEDLPGLVTDAYEDRSYIESLYAVQAEQSIEHISIADQWAERVPFAWPEDIVNEVEMVLRTTNYPDVSLLEHLMTLDGVDAQRISEWMHFSTNLFPIYSEKACQTLQKMGLDTPYKPDDIASYGLYVNRIEGLKLHAQPQDFRKSVSPEPGCCSWDWSDLNEQRQCSCEIGHCRCHLGFWLACGPRGRYGITAHWRSMDSLCHGRRLVSGLPQVVLTVDHALTLTMEAGRAHRPIFDLHVPGAVHVRHGLHGRW